MQRQQKKKRKNERDAHDNAYKKPHDRQLLAYMVTREKKRLNNKFNGVRDYRYKS